MNDDDLIFQDMEFEAADTRFEIICMCKEALMAVEAIDTVMMDNSDSYKVKEIKRKSLALIDLHIGMIYDENF
jgi:hypothetical protein